MVLYHRPKSGQITCYLNRTYHVLLTDPTQHLASIAALMVACQANLRRNPQRVITCLSKS
jgi:hypothetical protein